MIEMTAAEIAEATGGRVEGDGAAFVGSVSIDSRAIEPGGLFVALRGRRDGHEFVPAAFAAGAAAAMVAEARRVRGSVLVRVPDPQGALLDLAGAIRERLGARVVAITGSSGKTLTKELAAAALTPRFRVTASLGSYNNEIGVPLTILSAQPETEAIVAEVGSRGRGQIASLMPLLRPDVGVVTNVGLAHVGMFGSPEAIVDAKSEIVEGLDGDAVAVLNADDAAVVGMSVRTKARVVTFGTSAAADVRAAGIELDEHARARFTVHGDGASAPVTLRIPGEHMIPNALAAIAAAVALGVPLAEAAAGAGRAHPFGGRMEILDAPRGWLVIDDSYNANPASVAAALRTLVHVGRGRRTWAVLGEMAELGDVSPAEHERVGRLAVRLGVGRLVAVGAAARPVAEAARLEGMAPEECSTVPGPHEAADAVLREVAPGDVVLVKASRAAGLEAAVERLVEGA